MKELRERLGLEVQCFGDLEAPPKGPTAPRPAPLGPAPIVPAVPNHDPTRRRHGGLRTRVEARVAFPILDADEDAEEITNSTRTFSWRDVTSGLLDDSREEDERQEERLIRDLRGRVKAARAVVTRTTGIAEILVADWKRAARFYARFGITETLFRRGVPAGDVPDRMTEEPAWSQTPEQSPSVLISQL